MRGSDDFTPYAGDLDKIEGAKDAGLTHAFRRAMLLHGVDLPGLGGMTTARTPKRTLNKPLRPSRRRWSCWGNKDSRSHNPIPSPLAA